MKRFRIIEYADGHCIVQQRYFGVWWSTYMEDNGWDGMTDVQFRSHILAQKFVDQEIAKTTIKKITRHP